MFYKTTRELEKYVKAIYKKLKSQTEKDGIYLPLSVYFSESTPHNQPGIYCYSGKHGYYYCGIGERGEIFPNNVTNSLFEISYWILKNQVFAMASDFEHKNRVKGQDLRRVIFQKELDLLDLLGGNYKKRAEIDIDEILKENPFQDELFK